MSGDPIKGGWLTSGSIQTSLLKALAITTSGALAMAALLLVVMEIFSHRSATETNLRALSSVIALYSEAALEFQDHAAGNEALSALQNVPAVEAGILYDADGKRFASFGGEAADAIRHSATLVPGISYGASYMDLVQAIETEGRPAGFLLIRRNTEDLFQALLTTNPGIGQSNCLPLSASSRSGIKAASSASRLV